MDRVKGWKLLSATGVAMALFALVPLGMGIVRPGAPNTFWSVVVWPRLPMLLTGLPVVAAALITGCLARPWRPERLAAVAGGIGGFLVLALPYIRNYRPASTPALLLDGLITTWVMALPLAVSCWTGANYWRLDSWREFWRGPSGAIVKGGLAAGLLLLPLSLLLWWYREASIQQLIQARQASLPPFYWELRILRSLGQIGNGAVIAALLACWRPPRWRGALAGSGIAVGYSAPLLFRTLTNYTTALGPVWHDAHWLALQSAEIVRYAILAAIAGSFAGRWEVEPTRDQPRH